MNASSSQSTLSDIQSALEFVDQNKIDQAYAIFNQFSKIPDEDINTLVNFGILASRLNEDGIAEKALSQAVELEPDNASYLDFLAKVRIDTGAFDDAKNLLNKAIELDPLSAAPYGHLGTIHVKNLNFSDGVVLIEKAIKLKPSEPTYYSNIVIPLRLLGRHEDALKYGKKLIKLHPKNPDYHASLARTFIEIGKLDEGRQHLEKAIRLDKTHGTSYEYLSGIKSFSQESEEDKKFINRCEKILKSSMSVESRSAIHFSLGKIYNDCRQWDKAFEHYRQGNLITKPSIDLDKPALKRFENVRKAYSQNFIKDTNAYANPSDIPVFVVGMPRSGTTLIEQIIASHSSGAGSGELMLIDEIDRKIDSSPDASNYRKLLLNSFTRENIDEYTKNYLNHLCENHENALRIVDKMPDNFLHLGLIKSLFPNAHIVHAIRNPMDTCLSCYFQSFSYLGWATVLEWIGRRYNFYRKTMAYWEDVLPDGSITELQYESLVEDPQTQIPCLIESIGLPWEDQCMSSHKQQRAIATASAWQARQPIYKSSSRRWINYASHLGDLASSISEHLSKDDIEELKNHGIKVKKKWRLKLF